MTQKELTSLFKTVFGTIEGRKVLGILRDKSGHEKRFMFNEDERRQSYNLGRASLYGDILEIIKEKENSNGKQRRQSDDTDTY